MKRSREDFPPFLGHRGLGEKTKVLVQVLLGVLVLEVCHT